MSHLRECPFCGGAAKYMPQVSHRAPGYWVKCNSCSAETTDYNSREIAAEHWNNRTTQTEIPVEQLSRGKRDDA